MAGPKSDGRMINKDISDSKKFASLCPEAAVLFSMLIANYNPYGKLQGGPAYIKEIVCPYVPYLTINNMPYFLQEINDKTNVKWFQAEGRYWIHSLHFLSDHQKIDTRKIGRDKLPSYSGVSPEEVQSNSGVSPEEVQSNSGVSPEEVQSNSGVSPSTKTNANAKTNANTKGFFSNSNEEPKTSNQEPLPEGFNPDLITSDTPLPPIIQAEWDRLLEIYPNQNGIIKGRDKAVRIFLKSCERARILKNAGHYKKTVDPNSGFIMNLDNFVLYGYRDYDNDPGPLGDTAHKTDTTKTDQLKKWELEQKEFNAKIASGEIAARPRDRLPFESEEEYEGKKAKGMLGMIATEDTEGHG